MKTIAQSGLTGSDLLVYCALRYLSKSGAWKGSSYKLAELSGCGSADTARRVITKLINSGLVTNTENGYILTQNAAHAPQNAAVIAQNAANSKESIKENKNNTKQTSLSVNADRRTDFLDEFDVFWNAYNPEREHRKLKSACRKVWEKLPPDWKKLAIETASTHAPDRSPYWFLADEDFLPRVGTRKLDKEAVVRKPHWLTPEEVESAWRSGIELVVCKNKETDRFGTVTKHDAEEFNLVIHHKM